MHTAGKGSRGGGGPYCGCKYLPNLCLALKKGDDCVLSSVQSG